MFRPAGFSDDEEDDGYEDDFNETAIRRPVYRHAPTNGGPKSLGEAVTLKSADTLLKGIILCKTRRISLDYDQQTKQVPLLTACSYIWPDGVRLLLEHGADPNIQKELIAPLSMCCYGHTSKDDSARAECVALLLKHGADPNVRDQWGQVPLMLAAKSGLTKVLDRLLECPQTDRHAVDPAGWTALFFATANDDQTCMDKLIAAGLDPNAKALNGGTAQDVRPSHEEEPCGEDLTVAQLFKDPPVRDHYQIEEFSDRIQERKLEDFLALLPDAGGSGGFSDCLHSIVQSAGWWDLELPGAQLPDVLCGDEQLLISLGVKFAYTRHKILKAVHRFHFASWEKSSVYQLPKDEQLRLDELGHVVSGLLNHLVIINSAVQYLHRRMEDSPPDGVGTSRRDMVTVLVNLHAAQATLRGRLRTLLTELGKVPDLQTNPVDFVGKRSPPRRLITYRTISAAAVAVLTVSCFYFYSSKLMLRGI